MHSYSNYRSKVPGTDHAVPLAMTSARHGLFIICLAAFGTSAALQTRSAAALPTPTPTPSASGPLLSVDATASRRTISPYIYGMNFASEDLAGELQLPVRRWGGNATTRYNYQADTNNHASDWYFENLPNDNTNPAALPDGSASDQFIEQDRR